MTKSFCVIVTFPALHPPTSLRSTAVLLHFKQCPFPNKSLKILYNFPNRIRFGSETKKTYLSPEKILNQIQFGLEKSCNILERENSESNWNRFGKIYNISEKMTHLLTYDSAYLIIRSTAHHLYQHQNHQHQHFSESSTSIGIRWQTNC